MYAHRGRMENSMSPTNSPAADIEEEFARDRDRMDRNLYRSDTNMKNPNENKEEGFNLVIPQPFLSVETEPYFSCRNKDGETYTDLTSLYRFKWFRSRKYFVCNSNSCINMKQQNPNPIEMKYQCMTCLQYGNERLSYFCCAECLRLGWKSHCL